MAIFAPLGIAARALSAFQTAIQITGQNIANANTPGYTRQVARLQGSVPVRQGRHIIGTGSEVISIQRNLNVFIESQLKREWSSFGSLDELAGAMARAEGAFRELTDNDLSTVMNNFFSALDAASQNPEDMAIRRQAIDQGKTFKDTVRRLRTELNGVRGDLNSSVSANVDQVNTIATALASLNQQILRSEFSGGNVANANDLRDRRDQLIRELSEIVKVTTAEQSDGTLNVYIGGEYLVIAGDANLLSTRASTDNGMQIQTPIFAANMSPVPLQGGKLEGLVSARDTKIVSFLTTLDTMVGEFAFQFNKTHAGGRGLNDFSAITSVNAVSSSTAVLNTSSGGLAFASKLTNGSFQLRVRNLATGQEDLVDVQVDFDGVGTDETLTTLAAKLDAIASIDATISTDRKLTIASNDSNVKFSFSNDTSGVLAALGINTFFTGSDSTDLGVNSLIDGDPSLLALARSSAPGDNTNALALLALKDTKLFNTGTSSVDEYYQGLVGTVGVEASRASDLFDVSELTLHQIENQRQSVSGVNIDEEMVNLISHQRAYQAASQYIAVVNTLLDTLINGIF